MIDEIVRRYAGRDGLAHDDLEDMACIALNHLPPKYFRHGVDLLYYMSPDERVALEMRIDEAIKSAHVQVSGKKGV